MPGCGLSHSYNFRLLLLSRSCFVVVIVVVGDGFVAGVVVALTMAGSKMWTLCPNEDALFGSSVEFV
jgi:hypothetical protein